MIGKGRREPYTEAGIVRVLCARVGCGNRAFFQWQVCADGRLYRPLCRRCDIELNDMVLKFMGDPQRKEKMEKYARRASQ